MTTARSMSVTNGKSDGKKNDICYSHVRKEDKSFAMSQLPNNDGLN